MDQLLRATALPLLTVLGALALTLVLGLFTGPAVRVRRRGSAGGALPGATAAHDEAFHGTAADAYREPRHGGGRVPRAPAPGGPQGTVAGAAGAAAGTGGTRRFPLRRKPAWEALACVRRCGDFRRRGVRRSR
ncbi:hypothetical protein ACWD0J_09465 [Streptomyces sp. NPDC003011]